MKKIWERLKSNTPVFWKKVRKLAISIGLSALAVITIDKTMELNLLPQIITLCNYTVAVCVAISGTASLTKEDSTK